MRQAVVAAPLGVGVHFQPVALSHHKTCTATICLTASSKIMTSPKITTEQQAVYTASPLDLTLHSCGDQETLCASLTESEHALCLLLTFILAVQQIYSSCSVPCNVNSSRPCRISMDHSSASPVVLKPSPATLISSLVSKPKAGLEHVARKDRTTNSYSFFLS